MGLEKSEDEVLFFEGGITGEFEVASDVAQLRYSFCFKFGDIHVVLGRGRSKSMGSNTPFLLSLLNLELLWEIVSTSLFFRILSQKHVVTMIINYDG